MASVFLSYDRDDAAKARPIAGALERAGHQVWWDLHVRGGTQFSKVIEEALKASDVVVVLWSVNSIESPWVRDEAATGRDRNRLVPITIDGTLAPLGFRQFQTTDLSGWRGRANSSSLRALLADIDAMSTAEIPPAPHVRKKAAKSQSLVPSRELIVALPIALLFAAAGAAYYWLIAGRDSGPPRVAITAADNSAQSQQLTRGLLVDLGNLQSVKTGSMTLGNGVSRSSAPDLLFQAANTSAPGHPSATLALLDGKDHGVLWSDNFEQPSGNASDLKLQLAFTAGRVLGCTLDGWSKGKNRIDVQTLKLYLNACAQLSDIASFDPRTVIPTLRQVTHSAPHFTAAWRKLLLAEASISSLIFTNGVADQGARDQLRRSIAQARELNPEIAEADVAETVLLPPTAYARILALIDRAARDAPDDPQVLSARSAALMNVGRMSDAVEDASRAADIDPLSPALSANLVVALAFAGMVDPARRQLAQIEKLWPGTSTASDARYLFNFRYGDPKIALTMPQTQIGTAGVQYLIEARIDPSPANVKRLVDFLRARRDKLGADAGPNRIAYYSLAMAAFHQDDELFDTLMHWQKPTDFALVEGAFFRPELHDFRKEPRFLQVMKRAGLLDYWRQSGRWPDFCFDADMPYDCKKEAAKIQ